MIEKRLVEVYVGRGYGSDSGDWHTIDIDVDFNLSIDAAKTAALNKAHEILIDDDSVAFTGIYHVWSDNAMQELESGTWILT